MAALMVAAIILISDAKRPDRQPVTPVPVWANEPDRLGFPEQPPAFGFPQGPQQDPPWGPAPFPPQRWQPPARPQPPIRPGPPPGWPPRRDPPFGPRGPIGPRNPGLPNIPGPG